MTSTLYTRPGRAARVNAILAVERGQVRLHDRWLDVRLSAAVILATSVEIAECVLVGAALPSHRLDARLVRALGLEGDAVLDVALAFRVDAQGRAGGRS